MKKKLSQNSTAIIEIGTGNINMRIVQLSKGELVMLDKLQYPTKLGHDVFESGRISSESLNELFLVITKFSNAAADYGVGDIRLISCSALRDAENRDIVIDKIKIQSGLDVKVLEDSEEKALLYYESLKKLPVDVQLNPGNTFVAHIGLGSIGIGIYDGEHIIYSQNISIGSLKLHDILFDLYHKTEIFHQVIDEYLNSVFLPIEARHFDIKNIIIAGSELQFIVKCASGRLSGECYFTELSNVKKLYSEIQGMTQEAIASHYSIPTEKASVLYTSLAIVISLLRFSSSSTELISPVTDITLATARQVLDKKELKPYTSFVHESAAVCAENIASDFGCNMEHNASVSEISLMIFDRLKRLHNLDSSNRFVLKLASILHNCGSFVSMRNYSASSFDMIKGMDIFGVTRENIIRTAFVSSSNANSSSFFSAPEFSQLPLEEKILISKLAAIYRLANSLDKSQTKKLSGIKVAVEDRKFIIKASSSQNCLLEKWAFSDCSDFFEEIFGLSPVLQIKGANPY